MFLTVDKSTIKALADSVSGKDLFLSSQTAIFLLCPHMVEEIRELSGIFYKGTNPIHEGSTLMT